jgi:Fe(3+) dicitrate transport protein
MGKVVESATDGPLAGVLIYTEEQESTVSDVKGRFEIPITKDSVLLYTSYIGFQGDTLSVSAGQEMILIKLKERPTSLDEIIVRSTAANYTRNFVGSNFRLSPQEILNRNPLQTEELLRTIPGVNVVGDMGLGNRPNISIRGSWGRRSKKILLLEDGSPAAPAPYVAPGAYYNPVSDRIQSVEIYKGADMLRYSPNNMFGAVNYITAKPPQKPEMRVKLVGGQRNYMTGLISYGGTWNRLGVLLEGVYKRFDGFTQNASVEMLNLNAKIFADLSDRQSLYFKISGQIEDNQATLSSITPFTYKIDPTQNPFDADQFTMQRLGVDIIHKFVKTPSLEFKTKAYGSSFERDWWRQTTAILPATEVESYLGADIFESKYSYLKNRSFGINDYVRVGRIQNGFESTTDSRWKFTVIGLKETILQKFSSLGGEHQLEIGLNTHFETYSDVFLSADSSRWARSGNIERDLYYQVWSGNSYVRMALRWGGFQLTPILRTEYISMFRQDRKALSQDPNLNGPEAGKERNSYWVTQPGLSASFHFPTGEIYGSFYRGFIAPSKVFGFLVERDGIVTNPLAEESINIEPELSTNAEVGWKGDIISNILQGQLTYFNTKIKNFYAAGRNEVFREPGRIGIQGLEVALQLPLINRKNHFLELNVNGTFMDSRILEGTLVDRDLFTQIIHNPKTIAEFIQKYESNPAGYRVQVETNGGGEKLWIESTFPEEEFNNIKEVEFRYGDRGIEDTELPYTPKMTWTCGLDYTFKDLSIGFLVNQVGEQFTSFANFSSESSGGAIGHLDAFTTFDAHMNYEISARDKYSILIFLNAKNIGNNVFKASRLNRFTSGIFPGGFRQIIGGVSLRW